MHVRNSLGSNLLEDRQCLNSQIEELFVARAVIISCQPLDGLQRRFQLFLVARFHVEERIRNRAELIASSRHHDNSVVYMQIKIPGIEPECSWVER